MPFGRWMSGSKQLCLKRMSSYTAVNFDLSCVMRYPLVDPQISPIGPIFYGMDLLLSEDRVEAGCIFRILEYLSFYEVSLFQWRYACQVSGFSGLSVIYPSPTPGGMHHAALPPHTHQRVFLGCMLQNYDRGLFSHSLIFNLSTQCPQVASFYYLWSLSYDLVLKVMSQPS